MGIAIAGIASAAIGAGGKVGSAYLEGMAKKRALGAMMKAWQKLRGIDVDAYKKTAFDQARQNYLDRFKLFREGDPELAQVRDVAIQRALDTLNDTSGNQAKAQDVADRLAAGALDLEGDAASKKLESSLLQRAQENLDRGAELPPEFQAELVRSGLENAGAAGIGADRKGPLAQLLGKKIGAEQIALERQRAADALQLGQGAQALRTNRLNILAGIAPALQNIDTSRFNLAAGAENLANSEMPQDVGLTGRDVLNLNESNRALDNQRTLALGQLKAGKHIVSGETASKYVQAGTGFLQSALGSIMGGADGAGGEGGGAGGILNGLMGGAAAGTQGGGMGYGGGDYAAMVNRARQSQVNYAPATYIPSAYSSIPAPYSNQYLAGLGLTGY